MKFPFCPVDMKSDISLTILHQSCRGLSQMSYRSDIWVYPLQNWWRTVNEMSNFMSTGQMGNFIFCPVLGDHKRLNYYVAPLFILIHVRVSLGTWLHLVDTMQEQQLTSFSSWTFVYSYMTVVCTLICNFMNLACKKVTLYNRQWLESYRWLL